uniref:Uncharacterized protein n=1 Tax=Anguilla anguilla TaxID=7936 RepID=A0A0E9XXW2_ANGAN
MEVLPTQQCALCILYVSYVLCRFLLLGLKPQPSLKSGT